VIALLSAGLICVAGPRVVWAADDTAAGGDVVAADSDAAVPATATGDPGSITTDPSTGNSMSQPSDTGDSTMPEASPSPSPSVPGNEPEPPLPQPSPTPEGTESNDNTGPEVLPPTPGSPSTQSIADAIPLTENPALEQQFSQWDMAQIETPMFLNAAIDEFSERPILLTGNWSVKPHLTIGSSYDGNIFLKSTDEQADYITRFAPGLTMRLGDDDSMFYLMADYTVGFNYYLEHPNESTADQNGRAQFQWSMPKTVIGVTMDVSSDTGQDVDVQDRVRQELYFLGVTAHYDASEKTGWDLSGDYTRSEFNGLISSSQWEGDVFFDYQYSPKTQLSLGGAGGYLVVPGAPSQTFEQANVRATYRATGKLTLIGEVGTELREMSIGDSFTPIFMIEGAWQPRAGTSVDLSTRRSIYASAILDDQNYTATSLDLTVRQRITDYVDVSLSGGYVNTDYSATTAGVDAVREDNYYYIRPAVEWKALSWMSIGIYYEFSQDLSQGGQANSFSRDRGGLDIAILF